MTKRRVVITGLGLVCPLGSSVDDAWAAALRGETEPVSFAALAALAKHWTGTPGLTDSGVSMPMRRTFSFLPPMRTEIVSPSVRNGAPANGIRLPASYANFTIANGPVLSAFGFMADYILRWCLKIAGEGIKSTTVKASVTEAWNVYIQEIMQRTAAIMSETPSGAAPITSGRGPR